MQTEGYRWVYYPGDGPQPGSSRVETFVGEMRFSMGRHSATFQADYEAHQINFGSPDSNSSTLVGEGPVPGDGALLPSEYPGRTWVIGTASLGRTPANPLTVTGKTFDICKAMGVRG